MKSKQITSSPVVSHSQGLTKERIKELLPRGTSHMVSDEILSMINSVEVDTGLLQEYMEESIVSYMPVLREIKVDLKDYVNAIKYCNLKRHHTNEKAWQITFPEKYNKLKNEGRWNTSHVAMYNNSKIVTKLDAEMMVAASIQYAPYFHAAIKKQFELMNGIGASEGDKVSAHVQHLAAKELAELTKMPEDNNIELKIGMSDEARSVQQNLADQLSKMAEAQMAQLQNGKSIDEVQKLNIEFTEAEVEVQ